jgi:hypothetical protein
VTGLPLVAVGTIAPLPCPGEDALYFGGSDTNSRPAHNTAWDLRLGTATVLGDR